MLDEQGTDQRIDKAVEGLLRAAEANNRLPTPVEDLISAAGLVRGDDELFADSTLERAPAELARKIRRLRGKFLAALDRRERVVYLNPEISQEGRRRFQALHEVGHDILPWQSDLAHADDAYTLSPGTRRQWEREANGTAAELLFQRHLFEDIAAEYAISMASVVNLARMFGASYHASLRRFVESHRRPVVGVILTPSPLDPERTVYRRKEAFSSKSWVNRFDLPAAWPSLLRQEAFSFVEFVPETRRHDVVACQWSWPDRSSNQAELHVELFSNSYNVLVLAWQPAAERLKRRVRIEEAPRI